MNTIVKKKNIETDYAQKIEIFLIITFNFLLTLILSKMAPYMCITKIIGFLIPILT